jgi:hypothetical protein
LGAAAKAGWDFHGVQIGAQAVASDPSRSLNPQNVLCRKGALAFQKLPDIGGSTAANGRELPLTSRSFDRFLEGLLSGLVFIGRGLFHK